MKTSISKKSILLILALIFISLFIIITYPVSAENPVYVDDDFNDTTPGWGVTNFNNIQNGIDAVDDNGTVFVLNGIYFEYIEIFKTINLQGENNLTTIIHGIITYDDVVGGNISQFNITYTGGEYDSGLELWGSQNINISNNLITNDNGILLDCDSTYNTVYNNIIRNNANGIIMDMECTSGSEYNIIKNNIIINNDIGINIESSSNNTIYNNYFDNIQNSVINGGSSSDNYWNITKTPGMNIIGGLYLGGNYWSDYEGVDFDGDGIGESEYLVANSDLFIDYLPLTNDMDLPPILGVPEPDDGSTINPLEFDWSIEINDPGWGVFRWNISCSNGQTNHSSEDSNGTKILHLSGLSYDTIYTIWVNVFDYYQWTNETFTFNTKEQPIIVYVDDNADLSWYNETHLQTIQEGIDAVDDNGTVFVLNGIYFEYIEIFKTINLQGENNLTTIIHGIITYDDVFGGNISQFNITYTGGEYDSGLELWGSQNINISNNLITNDNGILLDCDCTYNTVYNNIIRNNANGIIMDMECTSGSEYNIIKNNIIINNDIGINIESSSNNTIYNNYFDNIQNSVINGGSSSDNYWNITKTPGMNIIGGLYLGGNYWSDYEGVDFDGDGIGESEYLVANSDLFIDYLPLTNDMDLPPILGVPEPDDGSTINPLEFDWSIEINDPGWGVFRWNISCSNGQSNQASEDSNGTKILHLSGLSYDTIYTIWVNVFDYNQWTNETFTFKTKEKKNKQNYPPNAIIDETFFGFPGEKINFDGSQSYDLDGHITSYTWDFGDGTTLQGKIVTHSYSKQGNYDVLFTVFDNDEASDTASSNVIIVKANNPPGLNLSNETSIGELSVKIIINITDLDGDNIDCSINWDDGSSPTSLLQLSSNQTVEETHTYTAYGTYAVHVTAEDDESAKTSDTEFITISTENNQEENTNSNGFLKIISKDEPFLDNQIDSRSIFGGYLDKQYAILVATILSIILLFLLNFLIEFFSDYSSERAIEHRKNRKSKVTPKKEKTSQLSKFLTMKELFAIIITTLILSFVLTWTWAPDFTCFWETFIIFLIIVVSIFFIREGLRSYLCFKLKFDSEFYVWPLGAIMMIVSTALGNTFSLAANHHYCEEDIKKCGKVSFIVSIVMYMIVAIMFLLNLFYHSAILQMIIIVTILNLFIDLFPLNPMDGHEIRHWNIFLWASLYIVVIISYVAVYFNLLT